MCAVLRSHPPALTMLQQLHPPPTPLTPQLNTTIPPFGGRETEAPRRQAEAVANEKNSSPDNILEQT